MTIELRTTALTLAVRSLLTAFVACGSDDASDAGGAGPPDFDGVYQPTIPGDFAAIAFRAPDYAATPQGCMAESCTDIGTYAIDYAKQTLTLTSSKTGSSRTLPLRILATKAAAAEPSPSLLHPRDLVTGGSSGQLVGGTSGTSGQLVSGTSGTVLGPPATLIRSGTVTSMAVNGQSFDQGPAAAIGALAQAAAGAANGGAGGGGAGGGGNDDTPPTPAPPVQFTCGNGPSTDLTPDYVFAFYRQCPDDCAKQPTDLDADQDAAYYKACNPPPSN